MNIDEYLESKGTSREALKDDAEKLASHFNDLNKAKSEYINSALKNKASKDSVIKLQEELSGVRNEQLKTLNDALKAQGLEIAKLSGKDTAVEPKAILKSVLNDNKEHLKGLKGKNRQDWLRMEIKAPATMTFGTNVSGGNIPVEDRLEGLNLVPSRRVMLLDVMSRRNTSSNVVSWVYQANKDGTTGQTAEGAAKNQIDFDLVVAKESIKKTTAYIKVSTEMLDDIEWLNSEINVELSKELLKAVEQTTYDGDGLGENHNGVRNVASAFAAGAFAGTVDNANIVDVLVVASNQIKVAQEMDAMPSAIFLHPSDVTSLKLQKITSTDKRYVERLVEVAGRLSLDGQTPIIESTLITQGEYLIGDFQKAISVQKEAMGLDVGYENDDFTKNLVTIRGEWRGLTIVKNNDRTAFVAGTFATDIAALETP